MGKIRIKFGDLNFSEEVIRDISEVIRSNHITEGKKVREFEENWGALFGYKHNIMVSSGTTADTAACLALYDFGAKQGDEIIAPALAFAAVGESIEMAGFKPAFVDIERETLNINPRKIEENICPRTKAIMAVHTMGKPCDMDAICSIAKNKNLFVIEDSCEAHGAKFKDRYVGNWGDMATFSYYVAHLICTGEGGMVSTNRADLEQIIRSIKSHGRNPSSVYFDHIRLGFNGKTTDIAATLGLPQIKNFQNIFYIRKRNLYDLLDATKDLSKFAYFNSENKDEVVCPHAFSITLKEPRLNASALRHFLEDRGIECKINFRSMPTQQRAFKSLGHSLGDFPEAEYVGDNGLHIGIHQYLKREENNDDIKYISDVLHDYFSKFQ